MLGPQNQRTSKTLDTCLLQTIWAYFVVVAEFSDICVKKTFFAHPDVKTDIQNFDIVAEAALMSPLQALMKGIFVHIVAFKGSDNPRTWP